MTPMEEPLSYQASVEETADGQFEVIVTTVFSDGGRRAQVGVHPNRAKAELAARLIDKSAKRYLGVGDSRKDAPTFANPEFS